MLTKPQCALTCRSLTLSVLADSSTFLGLLQTVLGPEAILMVAEPQDALTCHSSTLAVLPILDRFMGYYSRFRVPVPFPWFLNSKVRLRS